VEEYWIGINPTQYSITPRFSCATAHKKQNYENRYRDDQAAIEVPSLLAVSGKFSLKRSRHSFMTTRLSICLFILATLFCAGCAAPLVGTSNLCFWCTELPPTNRVTQADIAIRAAVDAKAADFAPVELQSARDKLARARNMMAAEKYTEARRLAQRAQVDAELAEAKAETAMMRRAADKILSGADRPPSEAERESRKPLTPSGAAE